MTKEETNCPSNQKAAPVVLMVSGGSDSTALLELAALGARGEEPQGGTGRRLLDLFQRFLPPGEARRYHCLHINHQLRGEDSEGDERFVQRRCEELDIPFHCERIDIAALTRASKQGMEACAREARYEKASRLLHACQEHANVSTGLILTAHTVDDRVETFLMRALVGTGPGGLASIPRKRGSILRPLLDATRKELREFLREQHPGIGDENLWREDATNEDGSNFRSRIRMQLMPVMRELNPGFEQNLARTMDLIASENDAMQTQAEGIVYRNFTWNAEGAELPLTALEGLSDPTARRVLRQCLLLLQPEARLDSVHIERLLEAARHAGSSASASKDAKQPRFVCDVAGGIRATVADGKLALQIAEYPD